MITVTNLSKSYDGSQSFVVDNISFEVRNGEILVLLGSSGCGKTTTMKMINRLEERSSGEININGKSIDDYNPVTLRRSIGYVFQKMGLFPHMTVAENVAIVLRLLKRPKAESRKRALALLEMVNLDPDEFADRMVIELSGGQQQRVGVARALANDPDYLLMDEPFGALDSITRDAIQEELLRLNKELHKTIIFVTHDIFEALRLADRVVVMHDGKIEQIGTPSDVLEHPATDFVRGLLQTPAKHIAEIQGNIQASDICS